MIIPVDLRKSGPLIHADFVTQIKRAKSKGQRARGLVLYHALRSMLKEISENQR